jgi:hypothetical protein
MGRAQLMCKKAVRAEPTDAAGKLIGVLRLRREALRSSLLRSA